MRTRVVAGAVASVLLGAAALASSAQAASPAKIPIPIVLDTHTDLSGAGSPSTFTSLAGVCPAGTLVDNPTIIDKGYVWFFDVTKTFTCTDGSGTFTMHLLASVLFCNESDAGSWEITGGTGAYRRLRGQGHLIGTYAHANGQPANSCDNDSIDDHFWGVPGKLSDR